MNDNFKQYFEELPIHVTIHDREFRIIEGNRLFRTTFGNCIGEHCYNVYKGIDRVCPDCPVMMSFADGLRHSSDQRLITCYGEELQVVAHTTPIRSSSGEIVAVMEAHTEIRDTKQSLGLQRIHQRFSRFLEEIPCFIAILGRDLVIEHANRRFRFTFGDSTGVHCYRAYKHREEQCDMCPAVLTFSDGQLREHEDVAITSSGTQINVLCTIAPVFDSEGIVAAVIKMATDITQIRRLESQLTSLGLLVGSISHGIKGLLTSLDGGIYFVRTGFEMNNYERVKKGWGMVHRNVDRIRNMVQDILYYAKDREMEFTNINVTELAGEIREILERKATEMGISLSIGVISDAGTVSGDSQAIRSMLVNILENSLEACHSDKEKPVHQVRFSIHRDPNSMIFEIEDNGIGMSQEIQENIFSLFFSSKGIEGTGLGLFISNKIVEKHGGSIEVDSVPGRGTRFLVRLPLAIPSKTI